MKTIICAAWRKSSGQVVFRHFFILLLAIIFVAMGRGAAAPVAPTDNAINTPCLGFYEWGLQDQNHPGESRDKWMATWLNRTTLYVEDFNNFDSWADLEGSQWEYNPAFDYLRHNPNAKFVLTVGLLPGYGGTPLSGTSLATGATGAYNSYFVALAQNLVTYGIADRTIIRLGHEFNIGPYYPWQVASETDATNYALYWREVVGAMHGVTGAKNIQFCWNPGVAWTSYTLTHAYPGNAYVNYIGADIYDSCYASDTYPYPNGDSAADMLQRQENAWAANAGTSNNGLAYISNFAAANGIPMCIPEWGTWGLGGDGRGGGDDPYYIQQMYNFIQDPANNVAWHIYFDVSASDGNHQLSEQPSEPATAFPNSAALFQQLFAVPPFIINNDIGTTGVAGGCLSFTTTGAGVGFVAGGASDSFHYASQTITGDTLLMAGITSISGGSTAQSGLMIRQSTAANDLYAALYLQNGKLIFQSRTSSGGVAAQNFVTNSITTPVWLKMLRTGNVISGYQSADGLNWTFAGSQTVAMTSAAYEGLATSSGNTTSLNTVGMTGVNDPNITGDAYNTATTYETSVAPAISSAIIMDSAATTGVTQTGSWTLSWGPQANLYDGTMLTTYAPGTDSTLTFTPTIPTTGQYDVYVIAPGNYQDGDQTPLTVTSTTGTWTGTYDEEADDALWEHVGTFNFAAGTTGSFAISNMPTPGAENWGYVSCDAVMFVPVPVVAIASPTGLTATPTSSQIGLTWTAVTGASSYHVKRSTTNGGPYTTLGSPTSASYTDLTAASGTTYYYVVSAVTSSGGESNNSAQVSAALTAGLPSPWTDADINSPSPAGSATYSGGVYTLNGGGADIWGTADQFNFMSQSITGDQTMIARVTSLTNTYVSAKEGLMFRDSSAAGAITVILDIRPDGGIEFMTRTSTNGSMSYLTGATVSSPSSSTPVWLKLSKTGTTYTSYYATTTGTPTTWTTIGSTTLTLSNSTYLVGLATCSHNNGTSTTSTVDNLAVGALPGGFSWIGSGGTNTSTTIPFSWTWASGATSFNIQYMVTGSSTWSDFYGIGYSSYALWGLTPSTSYTMQVQGVNQFGLGPWSGSYTSSTTP